MRPTKLCQKLTGIKKLYASAVRETESGGLVFEVRPRRRKCLCGGCGDPVGVYDCQSKRHWRHLPAGANELWLSYAPRRGNCPNCGVRVERVPWASPGSGFTEPLEEMAAYMAQTMDKTAVTRYLGISWRSVDAIVQRVVSQRLSDARLQGLRCIGIDEFSYRKRHRYLTVVVDHDRQRVVWVGEGKSSQALSEFFEALGPEGRSQIEQASIDMSGAYIKAVRENLPNARLVFDRFHVQKLASDALDEVRREQMRSAPPDERETVKKSRWATLKNPWNLNRRESQKLADIQKNNERLYRAYLLKEALAKALDYRQPKRAREALEEWLGWASRSKLKSFVRLARTIRQHKEGILAYIKDRHTNARVEGINNRIRMVARRAFGFHSAAALGSMIFLCLGGIVLNPPLP